MSTTATSLEAYDLVKGEKAQKQREAVLRSIINKGALGATCEEVELDLDEPHTSISARITELQGLGEIRDSGVRRFTVRHRKAQVYLPTTADEKAQLLKVPHLGDHIYAARKHTGVSIADLADQTGLCPKRLALIEKGDRKANSKEAFQIGLALSKPPPDTLVMEVAEPMGLMDFLEGFEE